MPLLEISLETARGMLIIGCVLAGIGLVLVIIAVAVFVAARAWYRAATGELKSPPEDDIPSDEVVSFNYYSETEMTGGDGESGAK